jgi:hypothetical protein
MGCNDIIGTAKGSQISEKYWGEVGKGKRADVYLEVRKMTLNGHVMGTCRKFDMYVCLELILQVTIKKTKTCNYYTTHTRTTNQLSSPPVFCGVCVIQSLVFCVVFFRSLFVFLPNWYYRSSSVFWRDGSLGRNLFDQRYRYLTQFCVM